MTPFRDMDTNRWPWRELFWLWCHPLTTAYMVLWPIIVVLTWLAEGNGGGR